MWRQAEEILSGWRSWMPALISRPRLLDELPGGRTNHSFLIDLAGARAVLRINAANSHALGIDRHRERMLHCQAAAAGLAPRLLFSDSGFAVTDYIAGRQWTRQDLTHHGGRERIHELISAIQALPGGFPRFDYVDHVGRYWRLLEQQRPAMLPRLRERHMQVMKDVQALQDAPWQPVVVHHDLNLENLIERNGELYLLDWEYAACGHPDMDRLLVDADRVDPRLRTLSDWMNRLWELLHQDAGLAPGVTG